MTSKIKVDNINKVSDDSNIIKKCGTTTTIGSGASNPIVVDGSAVTLGRCGGTVALASGATQTGFGRTGTVDWQTGSIKTSTFTAANGEGYFANTSGGVFTMNLPAGTAGNIVSVVDYTNTFQTNALTITPNGSQKLGGVNASIPLNTEGQSVTFVYVDDTEGWKNVQDSTSNVIGNPNLVATGGTITTVGNCKIHTFTGPGTFTVTNASATAAENIVSYLVIAGGGGGGGADRGGGGGAGGFRELKSPTTPYTASPLDGYPSAPNRVTVTATAYPITVGAGGAANSGNGATSTFSTISGAGGGHGSLNCGSPPGPASAEDGGSGGGGTGGTPNGASGNTPPVSPPQGNNGGTGQAISSPTSSSGGGGGGSSGAGGNGSTFTGGNGGAGIATSITNSSVTRGGGGGGHSYRSADSGTVSGGSGGSGGGGAGGPWDGTHGATPAKAGTAGTVNTGGGGGGGGAYSGGGGAGGSGIVVIRYKFQ